MFILSKDLTKQETIDIYQNIVDIQKIPNVDDIVMETVQGLKIDFSQCPIKFDKFILVLLKSLDK
jgi:hypothetical protein